jgi:hypothetical protein
VKRTQLQLQLGLQINANPDLYSSTVVVLESTATVVGKGICAKNIPECKQQQTEGNRSLRTIALTWPGFDLEVVATGCFKSIRKNLCTDWLVDSGSSYHLCVNANGMMNRRPMT